MDEQTRAGDFRKHPVSGGRKRGVKGAASPQRPINHVMGLKEWLLIVFLSVIWGASIIYFYVLARAGATNILLVTFLIPVSAIFLGVVVLGETPPWNAFAGMAMIFIGLAAIDGRVVKWGQRPGNKEGSG